MKNKSLISAIVFVIVLTLFTTICFATDNMDGAMQDMKDASQGAGNVIQDTAEGIGSGVRSGAEFVGNTISNVGGAVMDSTGMGTTRTSNMNNTNNNDYTATRTATTTYTNNNLFGIDSTVWTWIIMSAVGIAIIALVWYYGKEREATRVHNNHNDY